MNSLGYIGPNLIFCLMLLSGQPVQCEDSKHERRNEVAVATEDPHVVKDAALSARKSIEYGVIAMTLWDARSAMGPSFAPSVPPANLRKLLQKLLELPELQSKTDVALRILLLEKRHSGPPTEQIGTMGVFLGFEAQFEDGSLARYMFQFDTDEIEFAKRVLTKIEERAHRLRKVP